ncbi:MAG: T9SS type A sorting domain-containing protein [Bacteroidetes bacterium]|nr:T9SS type A sorting domain-containing protein [Bacteroidota bacterium]
MAQGKPLSIVDTDGDGISNIYDLDSDNDGISDLVEQGGKDTDFNGIIDNTQDNNQNGLMDIYDLSYKQTASEALIEGKLSSNGLDLIYTKGDCDGDGILNANDLDADGDNMFDIKELGIQDDDNNGLADITFVDNNMNGLNDSYEIDLGGKSTPILDADQDGLPDFIDQDADNDGILDITEAINTRIDDDTLIILGANGYHISLMVSNISNFDQSGMPDYLDTDTDNDGIADWKEGISTPGNWITEMTKIRDNALLNNPIFAKLDNTDADQNSTADWLDITTIGKPAFLDPSSIYYIDANNNGVVDLFDFTAGGFEAGNSDANRNGKLDYRDGQGFGGGSTGGNISLPLSLLSFTAIKNSSNHEIIWSTANELNTRSFDIEVSTDGKTFNSIGTVLTQGINNGVTNYSLLDVQSYSSNTYYRLKMIDNNGTFNYSNTVVLYEYNQAANIFNISGTANNFNYQFNQTNQNSAAIFNLYNAEGKQIYTNNLTSASGNVSLEHLAEGIYVYTVYVDGQSTSGRIIAAK